MLFYKERLDEHKMLSPLDDTVNDNVVDVIPSTPRQWPSSGMPYEQCDDFPGSQLAQNLTGK